MAQATPLEQGAAGVGGGPEGGPPAGTPLLLFFFMTISDIRGKDVAHTSRVIPTPVSVSVPLPLAALPAAAVAAAAAAASGCLQRR